MAVDTVFTNEEINSIRENFAAATDQRSSIVIVDRKFKSFNKRILPEIEKLLDDLADHKKEKGDDPGSTYTLMVDAAREYKKALKNNVTPSELDAKLDTLSQCATDYANAHKSLTKAVSPKGRMRYNASLRIANLIQNDYRDYAADAAIMFGGPLNTITNGFHDYFVEKMKTDADRPFAMAPAMAAANKGYAAALNFLSQEKDRVVSSLKGTTGDYSDAQKTELMKLFALAAAIQEKKLQTRRYVTTKNPDKAEKYAQQAFSAENLASKVDTLMTTPKFDTLKQVLSDKKTGKIIPILQTGDALTPLACFKNLLKESKTKVLPDTTIGASGPKPPTSTNPSKYYKRNL